MAQREGSESPRLHYARTPPCALTRAQSGRAAVVVPEGALPLPPPSRRLRRHRGRGHCRLATPHRRGRTPDIAHVLSMDHELRQNLMRAVLHVTVSATPATFEAASGAHP